MNLKLNEIKRNLNRKVIHRSTDGNSEYILRGVYLRKHQKTGEYYYTAELQDMNTRSLLYCGLEKVEEAHNDDTEP